MADRRKAPDSTFRSGTALNDVIRLLDEAALQLTVRPRGEAEVTRALERLDDARALLTRLGLQGAVARPTQPGGSTPRTPALVRRVQLPATSRAASTARSFCRETCRTWSLPATTTNAASDVVSELVANAAQHGTGPVVLAMELTSSHLLTSVWDDGPGSPRMLPYRPGVSEHGVGLQLVNQLSDRWGWVEAQGGKWVWARMDLHGSDGRLPRPRGAPSAARRRVR